MLESSSDFDSYMKIMNPLKYPIYVNIYFYILPTRVFTPRMAKKTLYRFCHSGCERFTVKPTKQMLMGHNLSATGSNNTVNWFFYTSHWLEVDQVQGILLSNFLSVWLSMDI